MAGASKYVEDANLNWLRGTPFPAAPAAIYLGMHFGDPTDVGTGGTEVTASLRPSASNARLAITLGAPSAANADAEIVANTVLADLGNASAAAIFSRFSFWDSATIGSGNLLRSAPVTGVVTTTAAAATSSSTTVTVASATGIVAGQLVAASGVTPGTTVSSVSGTTVTLSAAATIANGASLDFGAIQVGAGTDTSFAVGALTDMMS